MRFDDRLKTVLARPATNPHDRAVRWRQLVELLARAAGPPTPLTEQALAEIRSEASAVDEQLRAATARAVARPHLPSALVAAFASDTIAVAAPVLAAASLDPEEWEYVLATASGESRRFVRALHPGLPEFQPVEEELAAQPGGSVPSQPEPAQASLEPPSPGEAAQAEDRDAVPSISEVIARIERLRRGRQAELTGAPAAVPAAVPRRPAAGEPGLFRWESGASGEIAWVDGVPRGALVGRSLANPGEHNGVDERIQRAFALRAPFRDAKLIVSGEGPAAGEWNVSGVPAFEPADGRFAGYRGIATRPGVEAAERRGERPPLDSDALRELVHEIKTPLNAIIGFAEIIDGQYLGPADHLYRERAAEIVAQARLLLAAIEDLDLAAQIRSAPALGQGSADLKEVLTGIAGELKERGQQRGAELGFAVAEAPAQSAVDRRLAERLFRRFFGAMIDAAGAGDRLTIALACDVGQCLASIDLPKALRGKGEAEMFGTSAIADEQGAARAADLSWRLARSMAEAAGGDLRVNGTKVTLILPREAR